MAERARIRRTVVDCVDCGERIALSGRLELGQFVGCPECGTAMQVVSLDPVEVDWVGDEPVYTDEEEDDW
jgi:lysine biosynthesis protein LysW